MLDAQAPPVVIEHNTGGDVDHFAALARAYRDRRVIIRGLCGSACTMFLGDPYVCTGKRAYFVFHASVLMDLHRHIVTMNDPEGTAKLYDAYPAKVQEWINQNGGLTHRPITLKGVELQRIIPRCP